MGFMGSEPRDGGRNPHSRREQRHRRAEGQAGWSTEVWYGGYSRVSSQATAKHCMALLAHSPASGEFPRCVNSNRPMGSGSLCMNELTVIQTTQGLLRYLQHDLQFSISPGGAEDVGSRSLSLSSRRH